MMHAVNIKVEKGIPIPYVRAYKGSSITFPWKYMSVGDSFFVPMEHLPIDVGSYRVAAHKYKHRYPELIDKDFKITVRRVEGGVRVWRIK
jgi:hypothetical protein